jgi:hypothetical protein
VKAEENLKPLLEAVVGVGRAWAEIAPQETTGLYCVFTDVSGVVEQNVCGDATEIERLFQVDLYGPIRKELRDKAATLTVTINQQQTMQVESIFESDYDLDTKLYRRIVQVRIYDDLLA